MRSEEFDKKVRSMLKDRELSPAPEAWQRLEALLDEEQEVKSSSRHYWWVAAAVAVLVALGVSTLLTGPGGETPSGAVKVVEAPVKKVSGSVKDHTPVIPVIAEIPEAVQLEDESTGKQFLPESGSGLVEVAEQHRTPETAVASLLSSEGLKVIGYEKQKEVKGEVSDQEVEALLARARAEMSKDTVFRSAELSAKALLADVEEELDQNFKDKALEAIKKGIVKLRSAVAERNQ